MADPECKTNIRAQRSFASVAQLGSWLELIRSAAAGTDNDFSLLASASRGYLVDVCWHDVSVYAVALAILLVVRRLFIFRTSFQRRTCDMRPLLLPRAVVLALTVRAHEGSASVWVHPGCSAKRTGRNKTAACSADARTRAGIRCCPRSMCFATTRHVSAACVSVCEAGAARVSRAAAVTACDARGMRLCTRFELASGICCRSGCKLDHGHVWTSDMCARPGEIAAADPGVLPPYTYPLGADRPTHAEGSKLLLTYLTDCCSDGRLISNEPPREFLAGPLELFLQQLQRVVPHIHYIDVGVNKGLVALQVLQQWRHPPPRAVLAVDIDQRNAALVRHLLRSERCGSGPVEDALRIAEPKVRDKICRAWADPLHLRSSTVLATALSDVTGSFPACLDLRKATTETANGSHGSYTGSEIGGLESAAKGQAKGCTGPTTPTLVNVSTVDATLTAEWPAWSAATPGRASHGTLMKVDTEGSDGRVLLGARHMLSTKRLSVVIFECCSLWSKAIDRSEFASRMSDWTAPGRLPASNGAEGPSYLYTLLSWAEHAGYALFILGATRTRRLMLNYFANPSTDLCTLEHEWNGFALVLEHIAASLDTAALTARL